VPDDPYRLPLTVRPTRYDLILEPDLDAAVFAGSVSIQILLAEPTKIIVLNAIELDLDAATLTTSDGIIAISSIELDEQTERATIHLAEPAPQGEAKLQVAFRGVLNDKLRGFYRSTYTDADGVPHTLATTQFESTNARRAFPCFDEPALKAVFGVTLVVASDLMAISCGEAISTIDAGAGRKRVEFADTMLMSTYLVAFVVGELEATESVDVNETPIRIVHVPGKGHLTDFAMEAAVFSLTFLENYYGIPYPGDKIDLVAVPDFAFGAMENLGCVTFRETLLLADPVTSTNAELTRMADVIAHELAHMWFGDLVTMTWWEGIWLKEAFATFMEVTTVNAFRPEWKRWDQFSRERAAAFEVDSLRSTRPIEFTVVSPDDAEAMYDVLTYEKGAAVVRMLEQYLGEDTFREGVHHYLTKHAYSNTETTDLWDALEESSGSPVRSAMDTWIYQGGHPIIEVSANGGRLSLRQRQFRYDNTGDTTWSVPVIVRASIGGTITEHRLLMTDTSVDVDLGGPIDWVIANAGSHGFFRVNYTPELRSALVDEALEILSGPERISLIDDLVASVVAGSAPAIDIITTVERFTFEEDLGVWRAIIAGLKLVNRLIDDDTATGAAFAARATRLMRGTLDVVGMEPAADEDPLTGELRGLLLGGLGTIGADEQARGHARELVDNYLVDATSVDPSLAAAAIGVVAETGTDADFAKYLERYRNATTPQEEQRFLFSLAAFPKQAQINQVLTMCLDEVRSQNAPYVVGMCLRNRHHGAMVWEFLVKNFPAMTERYPDNSIARMLGGITSISDGALATAVAGFIAEHPVPQGAKTIEQHVERMHINVALRDREYTRLTETM